MKPHFALGFSLFCAFFFGSCGGSDSSVAAGGSSNELQKYQVESAIVEYAHSGTVGGTETLYFDRFGAREASVKKTVIEVGSIRNETSAVTITEGAWITQLDEAEKKATRMKNPLYDDLMQGMKNRDAEQVGAEMIRKMGGKKTGTEEIAGRLCDIWEVPTANSKTWVWKGITLKTEVSMGPMSTSMVATSVQENPSIPASRFEIPAGYEVVETDLSKILKR